MSKNMRSKVWDDMIYTCRNFNDATVEVWELVGSGCYYSSIFVKQAPSKVICRSFNIFNISHKCDVEVKSSYQTKYIDDISKNSNFDIIWTHAFVPDKYLSINFYQIDLSVGEYHAIMFSFCNHFVVWNMDNWFPAKRHTVHMLIAVSVDGLAMQGTIALPDIWWSFFTWSFLDSAW